jgi:hypothetical protein
MANTVVEAPILDLLARLSKGDSSYKEVLDA